MSPLDLVEWTGAAFIVFLEVSVCVGIITEWRRK